MFNKYPQLASAPSNHLDIAMLQKVPGPDKNTKQVLTKKITEFSHRIAVEMLGIHTATPSRSKSIFH